VLSPATRTKLATLSKGQLMVRHPHFTQPIFIRFPRPTVMRGRDGVERFPQPLHASFEEAVYQTLRRLDPALPFSCVQDICALHGQDEVLRARNATVRERPRDVKAFFAAQFRGMLVPRPAAATRVIPLRPLPDDDPYAS